MKLCNITSIYLAVFLSTTVCANTYVLPEDGNIVGQVQQTYSHIGETIDEVGRRFNVGYYEMVLANPQADAIYPLAAHTPLTIPSEFILPQSRKGIVVNLAEYRLYYFPEDENVVHTFPIGIGKEGWTTPLGVTKVTAKVVNPDWYPTSAVRAAAAKMGAPLPSYFPAGPNNPLGRHVLRLGWPTFLIHGTNRADGVGARVSAGCIRLLPEDIEQLFDYVSVGTPVQVVNQPVKIGKKNQVFFIQMHPVLAEHKSSLQHLLMQQLAAIDMRNLLLSKAIKKELRYPSGLVQRLI